MSPKHFKNNNNTVNADEEEEERCGVGGCHPPGLFQRLADSKAYLFVFCMLAILQGAYFTYTVGIVSTIEKRYAFDSRMSGLILIADNLSPIFSSVLIGYYANRIHRPRLVGYGMMVVVLGCLLSAFPYFIYGPGLDLISKKATNNGTRHELCHIDDVDNPQCDQRQERLESTYPAVSFLFAGSFLSGLGGSAFFTAGVSYLDDNIKKKDSPIFFSVMMALRLFGPSFGFLLSSYSLSKFEMPSMKSPGITPRDPRWVGAWWLGFIILGLLLFFFTIPMFFFPRRLKKEPESKAEPPIFPKFKDLPKSLLRLAKNAVFVFHGLSIIFHCNGMLGYYLLMPRYMEAHFRQTASRANLVSGSTSIITMLAGIVLGGYVIRRFQPRGRILTGYMVFVHATGLFAILMVMFLSCSPPKLAAPTLENELVLINSCNEGCGCNTRVFQPACASDGVTTYFTPCHAGCTDYETQYSNATTNNNTYFTGCSCGESAPLEESLVPGWCGFDCNMFLPFIVVLCVAKLVSSTGRVGNTLISLRCIDAKDKTLALGVISCSLCLFAFIPYPLIYGALADSTCLVWEETCGTRGNCWFYDVDRLRVSMHGLTFGFVAVGTFFDILVFCFSKRLPDLYQDHAPEEKTALETPPLPLRREEEEELEEDVLFMKRPKATSFNNLNGGL